MTNQAYKLLVFGGAADEDYLKYSTDSSHRRVWEKTFYEKGFFSSYNEANKRLFNDDNMVLFGESPSFDTTIADFRCNIVRPKVGYNRKDGAFGFQKESPFTKLFSHFIAKMMEKGLMTERVGNEKCEEGSNNFRALSYKDVILTFPILLLGCFFSMLYVTLENIFNQFSRIKR